VTHILDRIVETKRRELEALRGRRSELERLAADAGSPRDFRGALADGQELAVIAEVKRRSPGAGDIRPGLSPLDLARMYQRGGARALSVLTDAEYFGGSLDDLRAARGAVGLPVLRKDFTLHPLHVLEARAAGADAVLLIVRILTDTRLVELRELAESLGMGVLMEAHDAREMERALEAGARILGINNRDLSTFDATLGLLERLPDDVVVVSESGIRTPSDIRRLEEAGVDAVLVGESLLRRENPEAGVEALAGHRRAAKTRRNSMQ